MILRLRSLPKHRCHICLPSVKEMTTKLQGEMKRNDDTFPPIAPNPKPAEWNPS